MKDLFGPDFFSYLISLESKMRYYGALFIMTLSLVTAIPECGNNPATNVRGCKFTDPTYNNTKETAISRSVLWTPNADVLIASKLLKHYAATMDNKREPKTMQVDVNFCYQNGRITGGASASGSSGSTWPAPPGPSWQYPIIGMYADGYCSGSAGVYKGLFFGQKDTCVGGSYREDIQEPSKVVYMYTTITVLNTQNKGTFTFYTDSECKSPYNLSQLGRNWLEIYYTDTTIVTTCEQVLNTTFDQFNLASYDLMLGSASAASVNAIITMLLLMASIASIFLL